MGSGFRSSARRGLTQVQLAEAAETTQRAVSYYETEAGFPPAPAVIALARALKVTTDELLGVKPPRVERVKEDPKSRRQWKKFQMISTLPERDQKAVAADIEHARHLLDQLGPGQLAAVVHLLETMVSPEEDGDTLSDAERQAVAEADEWLSTTSRSRTRRSRRTSA